MSITGNTITEFINGISVYDLAEKRYGGLPADNNLLVNYNLIVCNTEYGILNGLESFDATNNWWGCNDGPGLAGAGGGDHVSANVDFDPWLVLKLKADPASILPDGVLTSTITADMTQNSSGVPAGGTVPDGTRISFYVDTGSIVSPATTTNGIATTTYTAGTDPIPAVIEARPLTCHSCDDCTITVYPRIIVGGEIFKVNKLDLIFPWLALAAILCVAGFFIKRRLAG